MGPRVEPRDGPTGSGGGARTHGQRINSPSLCQLSYPGREMTGYQRHRQAPQWPNRLRGNSAGVGCCWGGADAPGSFAQSGEFAPE